MIRSCTKSDFETIHEIINDGARFYWRSIPETFGMSPTETPMNLRMR